MKHIPLVYWSFAFSVVISVVAGYRINSLSGEVSALKSEAAAQSKEAEQLRHEMELQTEFNHIVRNYITKPR